MGDAVERRRRPSARRSATTTISAPYSRTSFAVEPAAGDHLDVARACSSWMRRQLTTRAHSPRPGKLRHPAEVPADLGLRVDEVDAAKAALAEDDRALHPRRPGADDEHVPVGVRRRARTARGASRAGTPRPRSRSACSRGGGPSRSSRCRCCSRCTRGSRRSGPPRSSLGRKGSAIDGRAAPIRSQTPLRDDLGHPVGVRQPRRRRRSASPSPRARGRSTRAGSPP